MTVPRKEYLWLGVVGAALIGALVVVRANANAIRSFVDANPFWGVFIYILLNVVDAVIAPGATLPLIPVAAHAWGHIPAALITTAGWTAGSLIAFGIGRRWGAPIVRKLTSMERLRRVKKHIGLFTDISWAKYVAATALGLTPSAIVLAYVGKRPHAYEIITGGIAAFVVVSYILLARRGHVRQARAAARHQTA